MFVQYCRWIPKFSERIHPLLGKIHFPSQKSLGMLFDYLKIVVVGGSLMAIEQNMSFKVETDASEFAIGATLSVLILYKYFDEEIYHLYMIF
ncbi:hypothetical protein CEXT_724391 [Caerostris extrusa]|uniref:Reverse transcriptase/retrotransposon-derived protein RNase H-like domain-containing protein n=1 Tax=Caerostris extrusa TaxID=172846 RepID=A0AAV4NBR2_CAEEX|nr:hypothetical protein CEXT_724391 [Caerostris extrusa]